MNRSVPHYQQLDAMDCGPTCLRMAAKHYGRSYTIQNLRKRSFITRQGVSMLGISDAAESIGCRAQGVRINLEQLIEDVPLLCILHWNQNHFVVLYSIKKKLKLNNFAQSILNEQEMNVLRGGGTGTCNCGCGYENHGGATSADNSSDNNSKGYTISYGYGESDGDDYEGRPGWKFRALFSDDCVFDDGCA